MSQPQSPMTTRREWLQALLLLTLLVVSFLWKPLTSDGVYGPGDLSQVVPILRTTPPDFEVANPFLGDVSSDIMPWQFYNRERVRDGHLPLWNPYNESGVPHLANGQSGVFSPFNAPFYVVPIRLALVVSIALALLVAGLSTYGLARRLGSRHWGGVIAAVGFTYSGVNMFWLRWPLLPATALIPAMAWATLVILEGETRKRRLAGVGGLITSVACGILSGHPETTFYGMAGVAVLATLRLAAHTPTLRTVIRRLGAVVAAGLAGTAVAAVQVLPTLEYISLRAPSGNRQSFIDFDLAGLTFTPFVHGSPIGPNRAGILADAIPYGKPAQLSLSLVLVMFAMIGAVYLLRNRPRIGAAGLGIGVLWWMFAFDIGGFGQLVSKLPGLDLVMALRSSPLLALAVALLAGRGLGHVFGQDDTPDQLSARAGSALRTFSRRLAPIGIAFLAATSVALVSAFSLRGRLAPPIGASDVDIKAIRLDHLGFLIGWLAVAAGAIVLAALLVPRLRQTTSRRRILTAATGLAVTVAMFATSGFMWRNFNPTVRSEHFYARSDAISKVKTIVGNDLVLGADSSEIPPDLNMIYEIRSPYNYDAIGVGTYHELMRRLLNPPRFELAGTHIGRLAGPVAPEGIGNLKMLGIGWVTTGSTYPWADREFPLAAIKGPGNSADFKLPAVKRGEPKGTISGLVFTELPSAASQCVATVGPIKQLSRAQRWTTSCSAGGVSISFNKPLVAANGLSVELTVLNSQGLPLEDLDSVEATAIDTKVTGLELFAQVDGFTLYRVPGVAAHGFSPAQTVGPTKGHPVVAAPDADPQTLSVVDAPDAQSRGAGPGSVEIERYEPGSIDLVVERESPGWLIVNEAYYPGWRAAVGGHPAAIRLANEAFMAVRVPAGTSHVNLDFAPSSVSIGLAISGIALLGSLVVVGFAYFRESKHESTDPGPADSSPAT